MKEITCHYINNRVAETEIHGTYTGHVTRQDILANFGNGACGHRFVYFGEGTFILVKYESIEELIDSDSF